MYVYLRWFGTLRARFNLLLTDVVNSMLIKIIFFLYLSNFIIIANVRGSFDYCEKNKDNNNDKDKCTGYQSRFSKKRYIFYDVNPAEGFNLRRDVYIRVAIFVKQLVQNDKQYEWNLILPPWGHLYHWKSTDIQPQKQIPWKTFFNIESLKKFVPVMEMYDFIKEYPSDSQENVIDCVYLLQNDEEMFKTGNFEEKNIIKDCSKTNFFYKKKSNGRFTGPFWGYTNITANEVKCLTFHGTTFNLRTNLYPSLYRTVMFDHMEIPLHDTYGSVEYWKARRSMRYNTQLYEIANKFRLTFLNSTDIADNTQQPEDWRMEKKNRTAIGGPYLAVHFRRQDFLYGHAKSTPSVEHAAAQIDKILKSLNLNTVFIATDTNEEELNQLKNKLKNYNLFRFLPTKSIKENFKDGGVSIIDQIICSHARYFLGTHESTFTFRIQEDREILGFPVSTTFNRLCAKNEKCTGSRWKIEWD